MKKWVIGVTMALLATSVAKAELPDPKSVRQFGNTAPVNGQAIQLGSWVVDHKVHLTKATYSVLKDGSILSGNTFALKGVDGKAAVVPAGAIIKAAFIDVIQPVTGLSGATAAIFVSAANDVWPAQALTALSAGVKLGVPSSVLTTKLTAKKNVSLVVGTNHLTGGKFNVFVEYYLSDTQ